MHPSGTFHLMRDPRVKHVVVSSWKADLGSLVLLPTQDDTELDSAAKKQLKPTLHRITLDLTHPLHRDAPLKPTTVTSDHGPVIYQRTGPSATRGVRLQNPGYKTQCARRWEHDAFHASIIIPINLQVPFRASLHKLPCHRQIPSPFSLSSSC